MNLGDTRLGAEDGREDARLGRCLDQGARSQFGGDVLHVRDRAMAAASSRVSDVAAPRPEAMLTLSPPRMKLPAVTCTMLVPAVLSVRSMDDFAPLPSATMAMTAATPITTPSVVRPCAGDCGPSARQAIWIAATRKLNISNRLL